MALPTEREERLALGKKLHEGEFGTPREAAAHFGVEDHHIYTVINLYKKSVGIPKGPPRNSKKKANGSVTKADVMHHLSVLAPPSDDPRIKELEREVRHWQEEATTLHKILMAVGRAL